MTKSSAASSGRRNANPPHLRLSRSLALLIFQCRVFTWSRRDGCSLPPLKSVPLSSVVMSNVIVQFRQGIFDSLDEAPATGRAAAQADHRIPFRMIVRDRQDFAEGAEPVSRALDHLVGSLAPARVENFDF